MNAGTKRGEAAVLAALVAAILTGGIAGNVAPLTMGALVGEGWAADDVGLLLTAELLAVFAGSIAVARRMADEPRRLWAGVGAIVVAVASASSSLTESQPVVMVTRVAAGLGAGALVAAGSAAAAGMRDPDRTFAIVSVVDGLIVGLVLVALPHAIGRWGAAAAFGGIALVAMAAMGWLRALPDAAGTRQASHRGRWPSRARGSATLVGIFAIACVSMGVWSVSERIGENAGMGPSAIGLVLGASTIAGLAGGAFAAILSTRYGRAGPVLIGTATWTASMVALALSASPMAYAVAQLLWAVSLFFVAPFLMGVAATLDPNGRWAAAAGGATSLGSAFGPLLAARFAEDLAAFGAVIAVTGLLSALLFAAGMFGSVRRREEVR